MYDIKGFEMSSIYIIQGMKLKQILNEKEKEDLG